MIRNLADGGIWTRAPSESATVAAQFLKRLELPDGSFYDFDYYFTDGVGEELSGGA